jgi:hypothetical protein
VLDEWVEDLGTAAELAVRFAAIVRVTSGLLTGTFLVLIGGTPGVADGTVAGTITTSATSDTVVSTSIKIANPNGIANVKLVGKVSSTPGGAYVRAVVVSDFSDTNSEQMALSPSVVI